jgi:hypothetical protein
MATHSNPRSSRGSLSPACFGFAVFAAVLFATAAHTHALTFDEWRAGYFDAGQLADPAISGAQADADGDGKVNLIEYALGTSPLVPERAGLNAATVDGAYLTLQFPRSKTAVDLSYAPKVTSSLGGGVAGRFGATGIDANRRRRRAADFDGERPAGGE